MPSVSDSAASLERQTPAVGHPVEVPVQSEAMPALGAISSAAAGPPAGLQKCPPTYTALLDTATPNDESRIEWFQRGVTAASVAGVRKT